MIIDKEYSVIINNRAIMVVFAKCFMQAIIELKFDRNLYQKYAHNDKKNTFGEFDRGLVICMEGEIGIGKTTFIRAAIQSLQANTEVTSPTFSLMNQYKININYATYNYVYTSNQVFSQHLMINHFDLYRLQKNINYDEWNILGFNDFIYENNAISFIEWSSYANCLINLQDIVCNIEYACDYQMQVENYHHKIHKENCHNLNCLDYTNNHHENQHEDQEYPITRKVSLFANTDLGCLILKHLEVIYNKTSYVKHIQLVAAND